MSSTVFISTYTCEKFGIHKRICMTENFNEAVDEIIEYMRQDLIDDASLTDYRIELIKDHISRTSKYCDCAVGDPGVYSIKQVNQTKSPSTKSLSK